MAERLKLQKIIRSILLGGFTLCSSLSVLNIMFILINLFGINRTYLGGLDRVELSEIIICLIPYSIILIIDRKYFQNIKLNNLFVVIGILLFLVQLTNIIFLKTKAGWFSLAVIYLLFFIMVGKYYLRILNLRRIISANIIFIILSVFISILIPPSKEIGRINLSKVFIEAFDFNNPSHQARFDFWSKSLKMFSENPITGIGRGKWAGIYPFYSGNNYTDENVDMNSAINPHNDYIEVLTEYGIFGFILFTGFIFTGLYFLFKKSKREINYLPFFLSALGVCVMMFFSFTKDNFWVMIVFAVCIGVGYSSNYELLIKKYEFLSRNKLFLKRAFLIIGILMFTIGILFNIMAEINEKEYLEAMNLKAQSKYEEMLTKLDEVSNFYYPVDMSKIPVDYYRGVGYFELKQYENALEKFRSARERMKYYPTIMNNEAAALYMTGNYEEAEKRYTEIRDIFPNYIEPRINLLAFYTNQKRYIEAKVLISEIESKAFDNRYVKNYSVFLEIKDYFNRNNIQ